MPGVNLTRAEAQERSALIKVHSYEIDLDLTTGDETFVSKTRIKFSGLKPGASTFIDAVGTKVITATLNGQVLDHKFDGESIFIPSLSDDVVSYVCLGAHRVAYHYGVGSNSRSLSIDGYEVLIL